MVGLARIRGQLAARFVGATNGLFVYAEIKNGSRNKPKRERAGKTKVDTSHNLGLV